MFDNGNGRHASGGLSRGLVYQIDEAALTVTGVDAYPLGVYSPGAGSAQLLTEGNWMFMAGRPQDASGIYSEEFEFASNTTVPLWTCLLYTSNLRNQNWIVKVAYQNGAGNGSVVWIPVSYTHLCATTFALGINPARRVFYN